MKERPRSEEGTQCSNCNKNRRIQTSQLKLKRTCLSHSLFFFIFSHHIPLLCCHNPSTVREKLLFAATVDLPSTLSSHSSARETSRHCKHSNQGEPNDSELSQHEYLISRQRWSIAMWQFKATRLSSQSSRKSHATSLDQSCPMTSVAWHSLLCSYSSQSKEVSLAEQEPIHSRLTGQHGTLFASCCQKVETN